MKKPIKWGMCSNTKNHVPSEKKKKTSSGCTMAKSVIDIITLIVSKGEGEISPYRVTTKRGTSPLKVRNSILDSLVGLRLLEV